MSMTPFFWLLTAMLIFPISSRAAELSKEEEIKAAKDASSEADRWASTQAEPAPEPVQAEPAQAPEAAALPGVRETPSATAPEATVPNGGTAASSETASPETPPAQASAEEHQLGPLQPGYNEMFGTVLAVEGDPKLLRITLDNGFNVGFTYDESTIMNNGGRPITIRDLSYGDRLQVRYFGKELRATEIERLKKAPRPAFGQ